MIPSKPNVTPKLMARADIEPGTWYTPAIEGFDDGTREECNFLALRMPGFITGVEHISVHFSPLGYFAPALTYSKADMKVWALVDNRDPDGDSDGRRLNVQPPRYPIEDRREKGDRRVIL